MGRGGKGGKKKAGEAMGKKGAEVEVERLGWGWKGQSSVRETIEGSGTNSKMGGQEKQRNKKKGLRNSEGRCFRIQVELSGNLEKFVGGGGGKRGIRTDN